MSSVGLNITSTVLLNAFAAPVERVKLLLQTQPEITLNLREETLATRQRRHKTAPAQTLPADASHTHPGNQEHSIEKDRDQDDDDDEPRSIIAPYAQLPYTDTRDCLERLKKKEGLKSLWRGYVFDIARLTVHSRVETLRFWGPLLRSYGPLAWISRRGWSMQSLGGSVTWILASTFEGLLISSAALLVAYPLATLQVKMSTDILRRTKKIIKRTKPSSPSELPAGASSETKSSESADSSFSAIHSDLEAVEWSDHSMDDTPTTAATTTLTSESTQEKHKVQEEYEELVSYKYSSACDACKSIIESEGVMGLFKGYSTAVLSSVISRAGFLITYRVFTNAFQPFIHHGASGLGLGPFMILLASSSLVNLLVYPLGTICHRRIVAAPGRYTSSWDAAQQIVKNHGWKVLYSGVEIALARTIIIGIVSRMML